MRRHRFLDFLPTPVYLLTPACPSLRKIPRLNLQLSSLVEKVRLAHSVDPAMSTSLENANVELRHLFFS
ncbi:unnamed protein product [Protopolystoma xenopodis]|uniref:Uncharacterized protein n=1 Tax=Protopolystoma xenopodis TaxID=117903 RepID=A0A448WEK1_9PLAT|nr:unnamed protein product [Protopolystoma xenopodis]